LESLEQLRNDPDQGADEQVRLWKGIRGRAPQLLASGRRIAESVMTAYVKSKLGL